MNGQVAEMKRVSYSLQNLVKLYVTEHPMLEEFLDMKKQEVTPGQDYDYWLTRGRMDAVMTRELVMALWDKLPVEQRRGFVIESGNIVPLAYASYFGLHVDAAHAERLKPKIIEHKATLAKRLGKPGTLITSPQQLSKYVFGELGLPVVTRTPKGKPSTAKDNLLVLADRFKGTDEGAKLKIILDYKKLATLESKFVNGIINAVKYNNYTFTHASPRIFGTYTGRFTYSAKTLKKYPAGIANHQLPREGPIRKLLTAPPGYDVLELDGSQQELRFIGQIARDTNLLHDFNTGLDPHSSMSAYISGQAYEEFVRLYESGDTDAVNHRYAGKLLNLSCQYRIGAKSLAFKFFTNYNINISKQDAWRYLTMYKTRYRGVVQYWAETIARAKEQEYVESIAKRRYKIKFWSEAKEWLSESSAINFPIQGSGADHKNAAISLVSRKFPEAIFALDLHDGLWYYLPSEHSKELGLDMRAYLNSTDWQGLWNTEIHLPLPFDAGLGKSFGEARTLH
jgi:DNA polymerase-1